MQQGVVNIGSSVTNQLIASFNSVIAFLPSLIAGIIILIIGWIIASILRTLVKRLLQAINISSWFNRAGIKSSHHIWVNILSQLIFWTVMILFLVPVFDSFHLQQVNQLLNQLVLYIPRVIAAVIISFLGIIFANLLSEIAADASSGYGKEVSSVLAGVSRYSLMIFDGLIVLNLLGIAPALVQIFLTGLMLAVALAIGLAFGLGGRDFASQLLSQLLNMGKSKKDRSTF